MATNFDFVRDSNPKPLYLAGLNVELPEYVDDYSIPSIPEIEKISTHAFADPVNRLHPVNTKAATILSGVYLLCNNMEDSTEMQIVKKAAQVFGAEEDLNKVLDGMATVLATTIKEASGPKLSDRYAITVEMEDGTHVGYYPTNTDVATQKSAQYMYCDFIEGKFPADWAHVAAKAIVKKAKEQDLHLELDLPERVVTLGTERLVDYETAEKMAHCRKYDGADPEAEAIYVSIVKAASEDRDNLDEYIKLWADMDMTQGIGYKETFTPQEAFFSGAKLDEVEKMASNVVIVKDVMVPANAFTTLTEDKVRGRFRKEIADVIDSTVKLASTNAPMASKYVSVLDEDNQDMLLELLIA